MHPTFKNIRQQEVFENTCRLTQARINPLLQSQNWQQAWKMVAETGLFSGCISKSDGGYDIQLNEALAAIEGFSYTCLDGGFTFSVLAQWSASIIPISFHGNAFHKENYFAKLIHGNAVCSNAITEPGAGSNISDMQSTAIKNENGYIIRSGKCFISNANRADFILLYALTNPAKKLLGGLSAFIVHKNEFKITRTAKLSGFDQIELCELEVNNLIPAQRLVGLEGNAFAIFSQSMNVERVAMSVMHFGIVARMLSQAVDYISLPQRGKYLIADYPGVKELIENISSQLEELRNKFYAEDINQVLSERVNVFAAGTKLSASEFAKNSLLKIQQLYGAGGHIRGMEIEQRVRDVLCSTVYSGTSEIMKKIMNEKMI
jgi:alkylation response protein AidB-like acyl-CoA dehydrogenase